MKSFDFLMAKSRVRIQYSIGKLETVDYIGVLAATLDLGI